MYSSPGGTKSMTIVLELQEFFEDTISNFFIGVDKGKENRRFKHNLDRYAELVSSLEKIIPSVKKRITLLDVGTSPLTFFLRSKYPSLEIHSLDYTDRYKSLCREHRINFRKIDLNVQSAKIPEDKFDIILLLEVIEHLRGKHVDIIKNLIKALKKEGCCIITTPNNYSLRMVLKRITVFNAFLSKFSPKTKASNKDPHYKEYSLSELVRLIKQIPSIRIKKASHTLFYDTTNSTSVFRKSGALVKPLLYSNYLVTKFIPPLRRGMEVVLIKI